MTVMEMEKERSYAEAADNLWDNVIYCGWVGICAGRTFAKSTTGIVLSTPVRWTQ